MTLNAGPVPLYYQLAQTLREQIKGKKLKPGDALPTEEQMCVEYGVSRITVRRALDDLIAEHLVTRKRGIGTFVGAQTASRSVSLVGSLYEALSYPKGISIEILRRRDLSPPPWVAEAFAMSSREKVHCCETLSRVGRTAFAATEFYFPLLVGKQLPAAEVGGRTSMAHLVERVIEEPVTRAEQTVEAEAADAALAKLLDIRRGTPLLHVMRTYFSASEKPVEVASVYYRPDQYQLKVELLPGKPPSSR